MMGINTNVAFDKTKTIGVDVLAEQFTILPSNAGQANMAEVPLAVVLPTAPILAPA